MAVRNISSLGKTKPIPIFVWIPPTYSPIYKIEVLTASGTAYDVTDILIGGEYIDGVTETIGSFNLKIDNSTQIYTSLFSLYDQIKIYMDYGTDATTLRFVGRIERLSKSDHMLILSGKSIAILYMGKNVTYSTISKARSTIISEIISQYSTEFSGLTTTNLEEDTGTMAVNYFDRPFFEVVEEICRAGSRDFYVDINNDFHYFSSGSRQNTTEAVVHEYNLISTRDFSPDASTIFNKVRVYGATEGDIQILATAEDTTSQDTYKFKDLKIEDLNIKTVDQAQARAEYELSISKDPPTIGEVTSLGLPTIQPGEKIRISDPLNGLSPGYYIIQKYTHKFSNDEPFQTILTVQKERISISNILKKRIKFESEITANNNPYDLDSSYIFNFGSSIGTHSNTTITVNTATGKGELKATAAGGIWISPIVSIAENLTGIEPKISGNNLSGVTLSISTDGGSIFTPIIYGTTSIPSGKNIVFKIIIASTATVITTIGFLYST